jgi:[ribosomal protein S18]-alanine N-acetyltransferase
MLVRTANPADIPRIVRLEQDSATAAHWSRLQYQQIFTNASPRRVILVIEEASTLLAFVVARVIDTEWEIENIAVSASARRRGHGTRLLAELLNHARAEGAGALFLEVRESNIAARALYEKSAFMEGGRRLRYYQNPEEDAIIYRHFLA